MDYAIDVADDLARGGTPMRREVTIAMSLVALFSFLSPLVVTADAAPRLAAPSCRADQMSQRVAAVAMKPPNADIAWYGRVDYTNAGRDCQIDASTVNVLAETGGAASPRAITNAHAPLAGGKPFEVRHDESVHTWLEVTDTQPKDWTPIVCPAEVVTGLEVSGPSRTWPFKYFAITSAAMCFAYIIKATSGELAPGV
jgi:hypothetical protein